jgi:hypothetical protein
MNIDGSGYRQLSQVRLRGIGDHPFWPKIAWTSDSSRVYFESIEGGDAIFSQGVEDTSGETRLLHTYGRHPAAID